MTTSPQKKTQNISEEQILKVSKEIVIKFIEVGRVTPASFNESFSNIHSTITSVVKKP